MFTGLIEEIGKIKSVSSIGGGRIITVTAKKTMVDLVSLGINILQPH